MELDKRTKTLFAVALIIVIFIILNLWLSPAEAGGYHDNRITNNYYPATTITSGVSDSEMDEMFAMSVAVAQHHFDMGTFDWQGSVGAGFYQDDNAVSFAVGKRFEKIDALFNASFGQVNDHSALGVGATFRF